GPGGGAVDLGDVDGSAQEVERPRIADPRGFGEGGFGAHAAGEADGDEVEVGPERKGELPPAVLGRCSQRDIGSDEPDDHTDDGSDGKNPDRRADPGDDEEQPDGEDEDERQQRADDLGSEMGL